MQTPVPLPQTPTPTPTPTPTYAPSTSLDFYGNNSGLIYAMFRTIFNESVFDVVDSGSSVDDFDLGSNRFSKFLFSSPYCSPGIGLGDNATEPPPPTNPTTQDWYVRHCPHDYRFMAAQTMINGFLNYERNYGFSRVFEYALVNFSGSIGNTDPNYALWNLDSQCSAPGDYADALSQSSASNSYEPALTWLENYADCIENTSSQGFGIERVQRAYDFTLLNEIWNAVSDFYTDPQDYTDGAFQAKVINFRATRTLVTCVGGCYIQGTSGVVYTYESSQDQFLGFATTPVTNISQADVTDAYNTHMTQISSYTPSFHSVAQPILIYSYNSGNHVGYVWETEIYQQTTDMSHTPR